MQKEKEIDRNIVADFTISSDRGVQEKHSRDLHQKYKYGSEIRGQLDTNQLRRGRQAREDKRAPEVIQKLNQEPRHTQSFHLSRKPVITKYS